MLWRPAPTSRTDRWTRLSVRPAQPARERWELWLLASARPQQDPQHLRGEGGTQGWPGLVGSPAQQQNRCRQRGKPGSSALFGCLLCFGLLFFFFKLAGIYLFLQSLPTHKPNLGSKQKCLNRRSETKQKASGRPARAALTSPLGARRLYLGTATVCGAAAPSGTAQNADFPDNRPQQLRQNH